MYIELNWKFVLRKICYVSPNFKKKEKNPWRKLG